MQRSRKNSDAMDKWCVEKDRLKDGVAGAEDTPQFLQPVLSSAPIGYLPESNEASLRSGMGRVPEGAWAAFVHVPHSRDSDHGHTCSQELKSNTIYALRHQHQTAR